ncbi:hypothetical protein PENSPDRAFT_650314 [Peniophora sp. CONT]|nr:hypothetical protein PENSPDRAFT_650314 [Peniophora sp. CONT]
MDVPKSPNPSIADKPSPCPAAQRQGAYVPSASARTGKYAPERSRQLDATKLCQLERMRHMARKNSTRVLTMTR